MNMSADEMNKQVLEGAAFAAREILRDDPDAIRIIAAYGSKMVWLGGEIERRTREAKEHQAVQGRESVTQTHSK